MEQLYRRVAEMIAAREFDALQTLPITKPEKFNWIKEVFEKIHVKEQPNAIALIWTDGEKTKNYSYQSCAEQCNQYLNFLRRHGLKQNDVIFSQMPLLPENWFTVMVSIKGGFQLIPAATILTVQDIVYRFEKLIPNAVVADIDNANKIEEAASLINANIPIKIIVGGTKDGWLSFNNIHTESTEAEAADTKTDDPLFLFFTSGTTGMPKVVVHTHLSYPLGHLTTASWIGLTKDDIHYNISQPGWAKFAWSSFFAPWSIGAAIFAFNQKGKFNAAEQLALMEQYKITTFCAPPTALRMLILENLAAYHFSFRECVAAGEPLNPEIIETWKKGTGITIRDGYGQTESSCIVANMPGSKIKFGSMGKPAFLYDVVIADEDGNELPVHEEGNITVRTTAIKPNGIFKEYFGDAEKKKEVFKYGLYYTGDKAYKDEDGYIWFVGRDDDVIKTSDYRVGPFEVESILLEHAAVVESAVVGSPHALRGFLIKAFVVLNNAYTPGEQLAQDIFVFAKERTAAYKMPRIIEFVKELPKTISGKIRRIELRAAEAQKVAQQKQNEFEYFFVTGF